MSSKRLFSLLSKPICGIVNNKTVLKRVSAINEHYFKLFFNFVIFKLNFKIQIQKRKNNFPDIK